jgi:hypothetical protein
VRGAGALGAEAFGGADAVRGRPAERRARGRYEPLPRISGGGVRSLSTFCVRTSCDQTM